MCEVYRPPPTEPLRDRWNCSDLEVHSFWPAKPTIDGRIRRPERREAARRWHTGVVGAQEQDEEQDDSFDPVSEAGGCLAMFPTTATVVGGLAMFVYGAIRARRRRRRT
jgi:hypothetical protein